MMKLRLAITLSAFTALLAGCATHTGDYPSLAVRDAERIELTY